MPGKKKGIGRKEALRRRYQSEGAKKTHVLRLDAHGNPVYGTRKQWEAVQERGERSAARRVERRHAVEEVKAGIKRESARLDP